jgi:hypothetical protein|tara:strand:+ start:88 stop:438 length:351 start_codon:yes stop_codon:yes gene_type:complete
MKKLLLSLLSIFSVGTGAQELPGFSTSLDFDEFAVVEKYVEVLDPLFGKEISAKISLFKESSSPGESQRFELNTSTGYMLIEREDDNAFTLAIFSSSEIVIKIEEVYEKAMEEIEI